MEEFTGGEVYQKEFDPQAYLEFFKLESDSLGNEAVTFYLECFCKTFTPDFLKGDTLIDLGSGPCIFQFMSACESFENIIASDYVDGNLQEIEKWWKNKPGAFDWSSIGMYVCQLEGNRAKWPEKEAKLRRAIQQVLKCDVNQQNPMAPLRLPLVDCVLSTECLESACKDLASYKAALSNIGSLLKPGGHLVLSGLLESTFLVVGSQKFSILFLTEKFQREALAESGFTIIQYKTQRRIDKEMLDLCDFAAFYFIIAQKGKGD
uniref:Indolethylamine N-methyltransferase-like n=1 Tax=Anolis carolinensis TaxID=28377 RepID=H9G6C7_ANOCA|nr:PREDICTED: nicotinamide N-methyltransferase isoform X1 [Anolis carolinensis]|eukprot:XP_003228834.1 PREDICTED: nicotinamide N-methyltransferase isoform X1 [Anolis carolinensis]